MSETACRPPTESGGDGDRWLALWAHHDELLMLARRRTPSEFDAEDVVHEALALAAENPNVELERAGAWLNRVVRNRCADLARERSYADKRVVYEHGLVRAEPLAEDIVCDVAQAVYLAQVAETLPSRQHEALIHASDGMSNAQIAARMSTTVKAIESLLVKARRTLRTAAAAAVVGLAYLVRRPMRSATAAATMVALTVGLSVYAAHPSTPPAGNGAVRIATPEIDAGLVSVPRPLQAHNAVKAPTGNSSAVHRDSESTTSGMHHRVAHVHATVGSSGSDVSVAQYRSPFHPLAAVRNCLKSGVVVNTHYAGCGDGPERPSN